MTEDTIMHKQIKTEDTIMHKQVAEMPLIVSEVEKFMYVMCLTFVITALLSAVWSLFTTIPSSDYHSIVHCNVFDDYRSIVHCHLLSFI